MTGEGTAENCKVLDNLACYIGVLFLAVQYFEDYFLTIVCIAKKNRSQFLELYKNYSED